MISPTGHLEGKVLILKSFLVKHLWKKSSSLKELIATTPNKDSQQKTPVLGSRGWVFFLVKQTREEPNK